MIFRGRYIGPYFEVRIPGFETKMSTRGADGSHPAVTVRIPDHQQIGGDWEVLDVDDAADGQITDGEPESADPNDDAKGD